MRLTQAPPSLLALLLITLSSKVTASPYPKNAPHDLGFAFLLNRQDCPNVRCGVDSQFCCQAGEACYTVGLIAGCSTAAPAGYTAAPAGPAGYQVYTLLFTEVGTTVRTSLSTSWGQALPTTAPTVGAGVPAICTVQGQTSCGTICCAANQMCGGTNQCIPRPESSLFPVPVPAPTTGATFTAPFRPTSTGLVTTTQTGSATTTQPFLAPATASGSTFPTAIALASGGGLSPGAIAGIVIGVIAGIMLLILLCFCCIVKAGFDGILAIFGLGKGKKRSTERIETTEHYSRHGSGVGGRESHGGWFGGSKPTRVDASRKKSSGFGGLGAIGAGLAGLALILGLKRKNDQEKADRSDISSSYYTDSYTGTSASSASSDRRTRDSRRSRPPPPR